MNSDDEMTGRGSFEELRGQDGRDHLDMDCERVLALAPTFVDGESSEAVAGLVRKHLIDCLDCRTFVQDEKGLRQWFEPIAGEAGRADVEVPAGFAARVTEMAFAGSVASEASSTVVAEMPFRAHSGASPMAESQERRSPRLLRGPSSTERDQAPGFLVGLTAIAAVLMVGFTLMLAQGKHLEVNGPLSADEPLDQMLEELKAEKAEEIQRLEEEKAAKLPDGQGMNSDAAGEGPSGVDASQADDR